MDIKPHIRMDTCKKNQNINNLLAELNKVFFE